MEIRKLLVVSTAHWPTSPHGDDSWPEGIIRYLLDDGSGGYSPYALMWVPDEPMLDDNLMLEENEDDEMLDQYEALLKVQVLARRNGCRFETQHDGGRIDVDRRPFCSRSCRDAYQG